MIRLFPADAPARRTSLACARISQVGQCCRGGGERETRFEEVVDETRHFNPAPPANHVLATVFVRVTAHRHYSPARLDWQ